MDQNMVNEVASTHLEQMLHVGAEFRFFNLYVFLLFWCYELPFLFDTVQYCTLRQKF